MTIRRGGVYRRISPPVAGIVLLVALAAVVRFRGLGFGLPHTQARPDETFIIETVRALLSGRFPPFYDYPWMYMWLLAPLYIANYVAGAVNGTFSSLAEMVASWPSHWEPFFLLSRGLSATAGTLTVAVLFALGRRIWDDITGLLAAFFLTFAFMHVRDSHFGTTDVTMTLFIVGAVYVLVDAHQSGSRWKFALAGVVAGIAAATKYNAVILGVPIIASYVIHVASAPAGRGSRCADPRLVFAGSGFALAFAAGVPFVFFDTARFLEAIGRLGESLQSGTPWLTMGNGWIHHLEFSLRYGIGVPLLVAGAVGLAMVLVREPAVALIVFSFPIAYFAVAGSLHLLFFRYAIPLVPFLCLAAARLVCQIAAAIAARPRLGPAARGRVFATIASAAALLLILPSMVSVWRFDRIIRQTDNRVVIARWFEQHVPKGSSVLQSGSRYGHVQFDRRLAYQEWVWDGFRGQFRIGRAVATGRPDWILVQQSPLPSATQPIVNEFLASDYQQVSAFHAVRLGGEVVYDQQDAFFVPVSGFRRVTRPGPNFIVYKRASPPPGAESIAAVIKP
jgi:4-amino-4-deoxy-L-arabinose transferase-like glycosyltransferase